MLRQTIAVDIDDVLADQAEAFLEFSNTTWGTNLTIDDYTEHWLELWKVDIEEVERRANFYAQSGTMGRFRHKSEALPVLKKLKNSYNLVVVTSRRTQVREETLDWINQYFDGVFDDVHFAGFFDKLQKERWNLTKADIVKELGASYLIDDQLKHCIATATSGIDTILFGDYKWNQLGELPKNMTRCNTWQDVEVYFDSRK